MVLEDLDRYKILTIYNFFQAYFGGVIRDFTQRQRKTSYENERRIEQRNMTSYCY